MATIEKRAGGSYKITVTHGTDIDGKKIRYYTNFTPPPECKTERQRKAAVDAFAQAYEQKVKNGLVLDGEKTTLKEFYDRWEKEYAPQHLTPKTIEDYSAEFRKKILPKFGHMKMTEIRPAALNAYLVSLTKDGARQDGRPGGYSKGTIKKIQDAFSSVLRVAVEWEVIAKNPMDNVRIHVTREPERLKHWTPEQFTAFLDFIEKPYKVKTKGHKRVDDTGKEYTVGEYETQKELPEQIRVLFIMAIVAGLRKGELVALEWSDIDFDNSTVSVTKSAARVNHQQITKAPKTASSVRVVPIPQTLT